MVHGYMANSRSVMLTVIPCNVDIANRDIIEKAQDLDPEGDRTFGVLTKSDLVDRGAEGAVVDLVEDDVGIVALKTRLQEILASHIRREFPRVKGDLSETLGQAKKQYSVLGPKRQSEMD
ncbi:hypothetical protein CC79DRAFT_1362992 [Sarocladium strictum]